MISSRAAVAATLHHGLNTALNIRTAVCTAIIMDDGKSVGIIGMGDMGKMYARRLSAAGWK